MNSRIRIMDPDTGESRTVTLICPGEEDSLRGNVSVFTPLGTALLGLPEGARMAWRTLDGRRKSASVLEVQYQPETHPPCASLRRLDARAHRRRIER